MCEQKQCEWNPCAIVHGHFHPKMMSNFYLQFSLFWKENFFVGRERKYLVYHLLSFLLTQPNTLKKVLFPIFSPKFFIYPISPQNKHTLTLFFLCSFSYFSPLEVKVWYNFFKSWIVFSVSIAWDTLEWCERVSSFGHVFTS